MPAWVRQQNRTMAVREIRAHLPAIAMPIPTSTSKIAQATPQAF
jgi:hypothetical protein